MYNFERSYILNKFKFWLHFFYYFYRNMGHCTEHCGEEVERRSPEPHSITLSPLDGNRKVAAEYDNIICQRYNIVNI